ncbi:MAG: S-layer homology domain-containing protein, partial [Clostridia bacterium]|nr:S-layer homology domain-containing protein [Clostridia bacterium]
ISILMVFLMLITMTSFSVVASDGIVLNVIPNIIDSSLNVSGTINSTRDNIPMTLHISRNGTLVAVEQTVATGKTAEGVPFSFPPVVLSATIMSGTLDIVVTASKVNLTKSTTHEYVGVDSQFTAIQRIDAALGGDTTFLVSEMRATASDLGIVIGSFDDLSDTSENVAIEVIKTLELDLPANCITYDDCMLVRPEIEKYKDKFREAVALGEFFDISSVGELQTWYDEYKTAYDFLDNDPNTPADEEKMLSYFNEVITAPAYLNRIANMSSVRKISDLNLAMKHQALLQQVEDSNQNVISRILSDFPLLLTGVNYQGYNGLASEQKSVVNNAVAGRVYNSLAEFTGEINAQILVAAADVYVPSGDYSSPSKKGGGGNFVAPPEGQEEIKTVQFTDIQNVSWAESAITYLYQAGIVSGKSEKTFAPNDNVTRAELAKMLVLGLKLEAKGASKDFKDVESNAWYADYVAVAASNGLITGDENGNFNPNKPITRQDAAVMMYRAVAPSEKAEKAFFEDYDKISDYSKEAVNYMYEKGIINGIGDGMFAPENNVTRAQIAKMLYLMLV